MSLKQIFKIIKTLRHCKDYILYTISDNQDINKIYSSDNITSDDQAFIFNDIKNNLIEKLGFEQYGSNLKTYDYDLFNAYKEADFQLTRADYFETAYEYFKQVNNPNGGDANTTYMLYKRLLQLRDKYEKYMMELDNKK